MYIVGANSCKWCCLIQVELPSVPLELPSHHRGYMSKSGVAHMLLFPSVVLLPGHHHQIDSEIRALETQQIAQTRLNNASYTSQLQLRTLIIPFHFPIHRSIPYSSPTIRDTPSCCCYVHQSPACQLKHAEVLLKPYYDSYK